MDTISISHATKLIQKRVVLDDVNVELDRGGIFTPLGTQQWNSGEFQNIK